MYIFLLKKKKKTVFLLFLIWINLNFNVILNVHPDKMSKKGKLRVHRFTNILKKNFNYENKNKYSLSPFVDQMQRVKTDSIRPQNKVGLPISVSDLMFLNIKRKKDNNPKKGEKEKQAGTK